MKRLAPWLLLSLAAVAVGYEWLATILGWPLVTVISESADLVLLKLSIVAASGWCCYVEMLRDRDVAR